MIGKVPGWILLGSLGVWHPFDLTLLSLRSPSLSDTSVTLAPLGFALRVGLLRAPLPLGPASAMRQPDCCACASL